MSFSLQTRFFVFLLLPVTLILLIAGYASLNYARSAVQEQWMAAVQLRLEKTAHQIQMRLDEKKELMELVAKAEDVPNGPITQAFLAQRLKDLPGVRFVDIGTIGRARHGRVNEPLHDRSKDRSPGQEFVCLVYQNERTAYSKESPFEGSAGRNTVNHPKLQTLCSGKGRIPASDDLLSMVKKFGGSENAPTKRLVVAVRFESFLDHVLEIGKWTDSSACLITQNGTYLARTDHATWEGKRFGESGSLMERALFQDMQTKDSGTVLSQGCPPETVMGFHRVPNTDWYLVTSTKGRDVFAPISRFHFNYLLAGMVTLSLVALLIRRNTRWVSDQIKEIHQAAHQVEEGDFTVKLGADGTDEIAELKRRFNLMTEGLRQKDLIEETFGRYVDKKIAGELLGKPDSLRLGGEKHVVTIMMGDLRGFTQAAERLSPEKVIKLLNKHFSRMISVIEKYEGIIVDFYGDSILAFFNGIEPDVASRAADAVKCALEMQREANALSQENINEGLPFLAMGIGIHTGEVVVGNIGSEKRAKYGIVGSAVNETDRIQSLAEGSTIIVSGETHKLIADRAMTGGKHQVELKGLSGIRDVYQVLAMDVGHHAAVATTGTGYFSRRS